MVKMKQKCEHFMIEKYPVTGDPLNKKIVCVKCGKEATVEVKL